MQALSTKDLAQSVSLRGFLAALSAADGEWIPIGETRRCCGNYEESNDCQYGEEFFQGAAPLRKVSHRDTLHGSERIYAKKRKPGGFSEIVNTMTLRSALEDFESNTLEAVPGLLGKLSYTGTLHDDSGDYSHWGLEKVYGPEAARQAIGAAHRMLLSKILKTPLPILLDDLRVSSASENLSEKEFLFGLKSGNLLPRPLSPGSPRHLRSVLQTLSLLIETRDGANHPIA